MGLKDYCEDLLTAVLPSRVRWRQAVRALPTPLPSSVAYFRSAELHLKVKEKMRRTEFDLIFVHCSSVAQYVLDYTRCVRIMDYGDLDSMKWSEYARWKPFPFSAGYALEAKKLREYERRLALRFDRCSVTTRREKDSFDTLQAPTPCTVIPNGVDTSYFRRHEGRKNDVIVFLGRMDYYPNIDGVYRFVHDVLPLIRRRRPNVTLRIVGSNPSRRIRDLARIPGVQVTGHVSDVRPFVEDAAVSIAPLRIARGTQNKILESMAMGVPVVASREAASGIDASPGRDLMVADSCEMFAQCILDLLQDSALRRRLVESALNQIEHSHQWPASMRILDGLLAEATDTVYKTAP
jgi:sugar transferase (PEP-CTERM/EpsH1 system associated)